MATKQLCHEDYNKNVVNGYVVTRCLKKNGAQTILFKDLKAGLKPHKPHDVNEYRFLVYCWASAILALNQKKRPQQIADPIEVATHACPDAEQADKDAIDIWTGDIFEIETCTFIKDGSDRKLSKIAKERWTKAVERGC